MKVVIRSRWDLIWSGPNGEDRFPHRNTIEWQRERWRLFTRYTLPSLQRQTHADWECWLLADSANKWMHDRVRGSGDRRAVLVYQPNWWAKEIAGDVDSIFLTRLDSDDLLAPEALSIMVDASKDMGGNKYVQLDTGVAWHAATETLRRWRNPSPPFYGRVVTADELRKGLPGLGHHGQVRPECKVIATDEPTYCVLLHGGNISNSPDRAWCNEAIVGAEKERIMKRFGL